MEIMNPEMSDGQLEASRQRIDVRVKEINRGDLLEQAEGELENDNNSN